VHDQLHLGGECAATPAQAEPGQRDVAPYGSDALREVVRLSEQGLEDAVETPARGVVIGRADQL
jgi:hypothetical protein